MRIEDTEEEKQWFTLAPASEAGLALARKQTVPSLRTHKEATYICNCTKYNFAKRCIPDYKQCKVAAI